MRVIYPDYSFGQAGVAQKEIHCNGYKCQHIIALGEFYTWASVKVSGNMKLRQFCKKCRPFKICSQDRYESYQSAKNEWDWREERAEEDRQSSEIY